MNFAWPLVLLGLIVPVGLLLWEILRRHRVANTNHPKILRAEAGTRSLTLATGALPVTAARKPRVWLCVGLALAIVAVARPQWGRLEEPVFDQSREILIALDLSRSMLTPDVKPSRLERAKLLVQSLLEKLTGERVGLVIFSGTSFLQSPLSSDYEILREFLPSLNPEFLPEGGTNYGDLIDTSIQAFGNTNAADRFLMILSDGEATDDDWRSHMDALKQKGIRVIGLGVGTAGGGTIPDGKDGLVKDERGAVVLSRLEPATLQELARATDGAYRDASAWIDLASLVRDTVDAGRRGRFLEKNTIRLAERYQWPLALAVWCLLVSFCYEFPVRPKPRAIKLGGVSPATPPPLPASAAKTAAVSALALFAAVLFADRARAALTVAPATPVAPASPAPAAAPTDPAASLSTTVGRLAAPGARTARDWADLAHETVIWGSQLEGNSEPVPPGPVHDALDAVEAGRALDPKLPEWSKLRDQLEALLKEEKKEDKNQQKPDSKNQQQQPSDKDKDQKQDQNKQDGSQQNQDQKQDKNSQDKQQQSSQNSQDQKNGSQQQQDQKDGQQKQDAQSAFGDMKKAGEQSPQADQQPPEQQESSATQKVGGTDQDEQKKKENADPALTLPLQKLDQLRTEDSPAKLFQIMDAQGGKKPTPKPKGKDW